MERYFRKYKEQSDNDPNERVVELICQLRDENWIKLKEQEDEIDPKVQEIIEILRDNSFGNEDSRKHLIQLLSSLHNTKDKIARKVFKAIGNLFTEIGDELLSND